MESGKDEIINFERNSEDFKFRCAFQVEDGTIFYLPINVRRKNKQILVRNCQGTTVVADLPSETSDQAVVHGNALYFRASNKIIKATFTESQGIQVSKVRDIRKDERVESDGLCYMIRDGRRYVYRLFDDPVKDGVNLEVTLLQKLRAMVATMHRGMAILISRGDIPTASKETDKVVLVKLPLTKSNRVFSLDSSPFLYLTSGTNLLVLDVHALKFLKPLEIGNVPNFNSIVGVCDGKITVKCDDIQGYFNFSSTCSAMLPEKYFGPLEVDFDRIDGEFRSKFANEFTITKILGKGGFGCVFEAICKFDNHNYAVKRIPLETYELETKQREVRAMALLDHPGIVRYNCSWIEQPPLGWQHESDAKLLKNIISTKDDLMSFREDSAFIYIQMQLCKYSLSDWLKDKDNRNLSARNPSRMKLWFKQLVCAVEYIHSKNLIHRDLKPNNALFSEKDVLKLCDLGIATERRDEDELETELSRTDIGTRLYMGPEQRSKSRVSSKSDVFTLGLILAELCVVMTPAQRTEIFDNYRRGVQSALITDKTTATFVKLLTQGEPKNRPSCKEMLDHLFLS